MDDIRLSLEAGIRFRATVETPVEGDVAWRLFVRASRFGEVHGLGVVELDRECSTVRARAWRTDADYQPQGAPSLDHSFALDHDGSSALRLGSEALELLSDRLPITGEPLTDCLIKRGLFIGARRAIRCGWLARKDLERMDYIGSALRCLRHKPVEFLADIARATGKCIRNNI